MNFKEFLWMFSLIKISLTLTTEKEFSYDGKNGVSSWDKNYSTCKGKHQSPININVLSVKRVKLPPLSFQNFHTQLKNLTLQNNGHTAMFTVSDDFETPEISGGPLKNSYKFSQFHFHWADNDSLGSEDTINGKHFPMELHMVFYKKEYKSIEQALNHSDGLTVLAFFFSITQKPNPAYVEIAKNLQKVTKAHTGSTFDYPLALDDYIHKDLSEYFVYNGSLTTPPCLEVVIWLDFEAPIKISKKQIEQFRHLKDINGNLLKHNFRPTQEIGDRIVWFTSNKFNQGDDLHDKIQGQKSSKKKKKKGKSSGCRVPLANHLFMIIIIAINTHHAMN